MGPESPCLGIPVHKSVVFQCCHLVACVRLFTRVACLRAATWWSVRVCLHTCHVSKPGHAYLNACCVPVLCSTRLSEHTCSRALCVVLLPHVSRGSLVCMHAEFQGRWGLWYIRVLRPTISLCYNLLARGCLFANSATSWSRNTFACLLCY